LIIGISSVDPINRNFFQAWLHNDKLAI